MAATLKFNEKTGKFILEIDAQPARPSSTGKTMIVAQHSGAVGAADGVASSKMLSASVVIFHK